MARPQKENGYTPIANELIEAICSAPFNATQLKIVLFIMRYTYGYSRKEHAFSLTFIAKGTGISRRYISSELNVLIDAGVLTVVKNHTDTEARMLQLNKNYDDWSLKGGTILQQVKNTSTDEQEQDTTGEEFFHTPVEEFFHQEKQNIKQNIKQVQSDYSKEFETFWNNYPRKKEKRAAYSKFKATKNKGASAEELIKAAVNYKHECVNNCTAEQYIKLPKTFLGPDEHWREYLHERASPPGVFDSNRAKREREKILKELENATS